MFRKGLALSLICMFIFTGCFNRAVEDKGNKGNSIEKETDPIKIKINEMTLDEKVGQVVIAGIDGYTKDENSRSLIEKYHVGGFILLKQNVKNTKQTLDLINSIKAANSKNKLPLFIGIDEEGGRITRLPSEFKKLPTSMDIGKINNSKFSSDIGRLLGKELTSFGMNMDFAPVLDINSNPKNPVIGDRSFGADPGIVGRLGVETMKGIASQNIIPVVKHFPGHGDTSVDSHVGLPVVNNDLNRIQSFELLPFKNAIDNGADAVMVAHILLPKIDPDNPASMSKTIITDILRKDLKFNGVVITDDMTMGAVVKNYDIGEAAVKAFNAGNDIILVCHDYNKETSVLNALKSAVEKKVISEDRLNESLYRILKLKEKYNVKDNQVESINAAEINADINRVLKSYMK